MFVRTELPGDLLEITAVHEACFPTPAEARLVERLRGSGRLRVSMVAEIGGRIVGHAGLSPVTTAAGQEGGGLAPVAVLERHRRRGVAEALVRAGLQVGLDVGWGWVVVLGAPSYYARFGFQPASALGLRDEYGGGIAFQVIELRPGTLPVGAGLVRYAPEFAELGGVTRET
jgi:putative acetyltransferase